MNSVAAIDIIARGGNQGPRFLLPLFLLLLVIFVVRGVKHRRGYGPGMHGSSGLATLQDRFARGEIDQREFDHRKAVLTGKKDIPPAPSRPAPAAPPTAESTPTDAPSDSDTQPEHDE